MNNLFSANKMRGRKKISYIEKRYRNIKELADRFMESESASAYIGRALLATVALGGIFAVGAVAPNIFSAFGRYSKRHNFSEKQIQKSFYYLRRKKLIKILNEKDGVSRVKITKSGQKKFKEFAIDTMSINIPRRWDRKWRAVVFDVPEKYKAARDSLRRKLRELGFYQLQRSIFVHPYPVEEEVLFVAALFDIERFVEILTIDNLLDEKPLRNFFNI